MTRPRSKPLPVIVRRDHHAEPLSCLRLSPDACAPGGERDDLGADRGAFWLWLVCAGLPLALLILVLRLVLGPV